MGRKDKMITVKQLEEFCFLSLCREGMAPEDASVTARVLAWTDAVGTHSHGTANLRDYIHKIRAGGIQLRAKPKMIKEEPAFAVMDGQAAIGMVPACHAMELAVEKASACGVGIVIVTNTTHFGAAGYYANMAAERGMIGISMSNVDPNMTIPGARSNVIGNKPFAYAVPAESTPSIFLDIAMSSVASLKVIRAKKEAAKIPDTWIVNSEGLPTTDPSEYPEKCAMQPMAAHKGYGLALMIEMLTGLLVGGGCSITGEIRSWLFDLHAHNHVTQTFIAINIDSFSTKKGFLRRVEQVADVLHSAPKAKNCERIYLPGEQEWEHYAEAEKNGLHLPEEVIASLRQLSKENGIAFCFADGDKNQYQEG